MKLHRIKESLFLKFISISTVLLFFIGCSSSPKLGNSSLSNVPVDVYVGGESFISSTNVPVAVYWKNGEMVILSTKYWKDDEKKPQYSTEMSRVNSIVVTGNDIYAGGYYIKYDLSDVTHDGRGMDDYEVKVACYWKNGKLVSLSNSKYGSEVYAIFVSGNDVYAGGWIRKGKDAAWTGYWKNGKWVKLGSSIESIFASGDDVYACGRSRTGYWKNGEWVVLPCHSEEKKAYTYSIFVSGNDVYVCGESRNNLRIDAACYWKNGEIIPLLSSDSKHNSRATSIFVLGKDVYIGGYSYNNPFSSLTSHYVAGYWKNDKWIELPCIDNTSISKVTSIFVYGKDVYSGGYSNDIPGYWKNGKWIGLSNTKRGEVSSIVVVPRTTGGEWE